MTGSQGVDDQHGDDDAMGRVQQGMSKLPDAYFDAIGDEACAGMGLLSLPQMEEQSADFLGFHPTVQCLGGIVLDDTDTSDHHLLLTAPALAGSVFFLAHDGDSRVVFATVPDFLAAVRTARAQDVSVRDLHPAHSPVATDQAALSQLINDLLDNATSSETIVSLIPSLDLHDHALLRRLAADEDFFLAEAVAVALQKRPSPDLRAIAVLCAAHPHSQAASAGARALARMSRRG